jgi:hypothetical protein
MYVSAEKHVYVSAGKQGTADIADRRLPDSRRCGSGALKEAKVRQQMWCESGASPYLLD